MAAAGLLFSLGYFLEQQDFFDNFSHLGSNFLLYLSELGIFGIFLIAAAANSAVLIQIPYTIPFFTAVITSRDLPHVLLLAVSAGIGATIGRLIAYAIADKLLSHKQGLQQNRLCRWVKKTVEAHPHLAPLLVFIWAATALLPDDMVLIPLATINYGLRKLWLPIFIGKLIDNLTLALVFYYSSEMTSGVGGLKCEFLFGILGAILLLLLYKNEKNVKGT